jgi:dsRNA-specific ribonuclease
MEPFDLEKYRTFVKQMLKIANINEEYREKFTDDEAMKMFVMVITHRSVDPKNNYEELEFIGDSILKGIIAQYILRRFPNLSEISELTTKKGTTEGSLSLIKQKLEQKKNLSSMALKLGFWDYVRCSPEVREKDRNASLEDVYEAFIGALTTIIDERIKRGLGYMYAYNFVSSSLDEIEIDVSQLKDPISSLTMLYKANTIKSGKPPLKWGDPLKYEQRIYVPKYTDKNLIPTTASIGDIVGIQEGPNRQISVYTRNGWTPNIGLDTVINIQKYIHNEVITEEFKQLHIPLFYVGIYGFFDERGNPIPGINVDPKNKDRILTNIEGYRGRIIGQGLFYDKDNAKKNAARGALFYMKKIGYEI